jgi:hypothetical protein
VRGVQRGVACGWRVGDAVVARGAGCWQEVVIGVYAPVRLVVVVLGLVYKLPELVYPVDPAFEPLVLVCEPFALASISIRLSFLFGLLVLSIGVVAVLGWVYVTVLVLVFVGIGFGWGLGLSWTWCDRGGGCALFCLGYVVVIVRIRVTAIAVAPHVGRVGFGCGIPEVLRVQIARVGVIK